MRPVSPFGGSDAFEVKLLHAPADGVAPAVLVKVANGPEVKSIGLQ